MSTQEHIITTLGVKPLINAAEEIRTRIDFLKKFTKENGTLGFVLGISGGQDSSLAGRLAQIAAEELRTEGHPASFTALRLPYGTQTDEADAQRALKFIQPDRTETYNIKPVVDAFVEEYNRIDAPITDFIKGNLKARQRMVAQYAIAGQEGYLVIGTDHAAEAVSGFFTKFGDGAADILPLSGLTKRQGKELLKVLGADPAIYNKIPTADLLDEVTGQPDETELGITYDEIDDYLEGKQIPADKAGIIEVRYLLTEHKRHAPVTPTDTWWVEEN